MWTNHTAKRKVNRLVSGVWGSKLPASVSCDLRSIRWLADVGLTWSTGVCLYRVVGCFFSEFCLLSFDSQSWAALKMFTLYTFEVWASWNFVCYIVKTWNSKKKFRYLFQMYKYSVVKIIYLFKFKIIQNRFNSINVPFKKKIFDI